VPNHLTIEDILRLIAWPLLGASVGAVVTFFYNRRLAGVKVAIDLHSEFHSESFLKTRIAADNILTKLKDGSNQIRLSRIYSQCCPTQWESVSRIIHFFERLAVMRAEGLVHRNTCDHLLGHYVNYFHKTYFAYLVEEPEWNPIVTTLKTLADVTTPHNNGMLRMLRYIVRAVRIVRREWQASKEITT